MSRPSGGGFIAPLRRRAAFRPSRLREGGVNASLVTTSSMLTITALLTTRLRRLLLGAALTAFVAAWPAADTDPAFAGGFDLYACGADGDERLFDFVDYSGGSVFTGHNCPADFSNQGVMSRTTGAAAVRNWTAAAVFYAPAGTSITDIHGDINIVDDQVEATGWTAGLSDDGDYYFWGGPNHSWGVYTSYAQWVPFDFNVGSLQRFSLSVMCVWASCPSKSGTPYAFVTMRNLRIHLVDFSAPALANGRGRLWTTNASTDWLSGVQSAGFDASDNAGIKRAWIDIDGGLVTDRAGGCDFHRRKPCDDYGTILDLDTRGLADGAHTVTFKAQDAADNVNATSHTFRVDNHAPAQPSTPQLAGAGASTWRTTNEFTLTYSNPDTAGGSAATSSDVQVCKLDPATGSPDPAQCAMRQSGAAASEANTFSVPSVGEFKARVRIHDALYAGAWSDWSPRLRFDDTVPVGAVPDQRNGWMNANDVKTGYFVRMPKDYAPSPSGIAGYSVSIDGSVPDSSVDVAAEPGNTYVASYDLTPLPNGTTTIMARAVSGALVAGTVVGQENVRIDRLPPTVDAVGGAGTRWVRDAVTLNVTGTDQSGLSGMAGAENSDPNYTDGAYLTYEVDGGVAHHVRGGSATIPLADDGSHIITVQATDLAGNDGQRKSVMVKIDREAPTLAIEGVPENNVLVNGDVTLKMAATDKLSGMDAAPADQATSDGGYLEYQLDGGGMQASRGATTSITVSDDGTHTMRARAVDNAGNASAWRTVTFSQDKTRPGGGLETADPNNPRLISFYVSEACIKSASIELRRPGGEWFALDTTISDHHVSATVPDEIWNERGSYEVRALVTDCAGNSAILDRQYGGSHDGAAAVVALPARVATALKASFARLTVRCVTRRKASKVAACKVGVKKATRPRKRAKSKPKATRVVHGVLMTDGGLPLTRQAVDLQVRPRMLMSAWKTIRTARTDGRGRVVFHLPKSPSLEARLVFQQTDGFGASRSASLRTSVRAGATIKASVRTVRNGGAVRFSGKLSGGYLPKHGREVELQGYNPAKRRWIPIRTAGLKADKKGRWKAAYRFTATRRITTYAFRLRVPARPDYPFAAGYSKIVKVTVTP
jgi:hypothetical protein